MKTRAAWGRNKERGTIRFKRIGARPQDVLLLQWVDRNVVSILSTYHSANDYDFCKRNVKENGSHKKVDVVRPQCVSDYNQDMNGVDLSDQMYQMYSVQYRTRQFWKTLFFHFVDIAVWNAFVFWSELKNPPADAKMPKNYTYLDFKIDLVKQLANTDQKSICDSISAQPYAPLERKPNDIDTFTSEATSHAVSRATRRVSKDREGFTKNQEWERRLQAGHLPVKLDKARMCKVCSVLLAAHGTESTKRPKRSTFACIVCDIPLCIGERNCFLLFHSLEFEQHKDIFFVHCRHT